MQDVNGRWFETLGGITTLDLGHNVLKSLPANVASLSLRALILDFNPLTPRALELILFPMGSAPNNLSSSITQLNVSNCRIDSLPEQLFELPNLCELILSHNELESLDGRGGWVVGGGLKMLSLLDLSNNKLCNLGMLSQDLKFKRNIRTLLLGNNELRKIDYTLGYVQTLTAIDLRGNPQRAVRPNVLDKPCGELLEYFRNKIISCDDAVAPNPSALVCTSASVSAPASTIDGRSSRPRRDRERLHDLHDEYDGDGTRNTEATTITTTTTTNNNENDEILSIQHRIQDIELAMKNVYITEMKKWQLKKELAKEKSFLIRANRKRLQQAGNSASSSFKATYH